MGKGGCGARSLVFLLVCVIVAEVFYVFSSGGRGSSNAASSLRGQGEERAAAISTLQDQLNVLNQTLSLLHQELRATERATQQLAIASENTAPVARKETARLAAAATTAITATATTVATAASRRPRLALLYTMDSIGSYEDNSRRGGAAGEILVRRCLEASLRNLGVQLRVVKSDEEFDNLGRSSVAKYDFILLDPWTWAAKGWVPKAPIRGLDAKIFILDFFGSPRLKGSGLNVPATRFLTAFGSPWNTFLGFYLPPVSASTTPHLKQGVIWGKDVKHFDGKEAMLRHVADQGVALVSTASTPTGGGLFQHPKVQWLGHQSPQGWHHLLASSSFLLGMGDPLLGPSVIEAIAAGCLYINPIYSGEPAKNGLLSQHPWAAEKVPEYVCSYHPDRTDQLMACVRRALETSLPPHLPPEFQESAHRERVKAIFGL